jgi:hypothetical protein
MYSVELKYIGDFTLHISVINTSIILHFTMPEVAQLKYTI